jgi:hypothetical protein
MVVLEPADEWTPEFTSTLGGWTEAIERPFANAARKAAS